MLAVRDGDVDRLSVLFERYHRRLYEFFRRMNAERSTAEDLVQDVFYRVLKYRHTFRDENLFVPWLYKIARNARFQHHRKRGVHVPDAGTTTSPDAEYERDQQAMLLRCAMEQLPDDKREVLVLAWYQDLKYEVIAELLGISVGAVKVRVYRAVRELRDILGKENGENPSCAVKTLKTTLRTT